MAQQEKGRVPQHVLDAYQRGFEDGLRQIPLGQLGGPGLAARPCDACAALHELMGIATGPVRLTPQDGGKTVYAKAGIRTRFWPAHYVLFVGTNYPAPADYLPGLLRKVEDVANGALRPSPDQYRG